MNDVMDQIIESLAFEIEAVPNENKGQISTGLSDPINIKIRIRNKDRNKILRQGAISIPKKDDPTYSSGKIQLSSSDQTIMSFNVLMKQDESTKKQIQKQKRKFRFFKKGGCLGNQTDEDLYETQKKVSMDNQLVPIKSTSINDINKRNFTLTKNYVNSDTGRMSKRTHKDILGQCKPGGCLDPPYGEDKYSYVPKLLQISKSQKNLTKLKTNEIEYQKPLKKNTNLDDRNKISYVFENKKESSFPTNINLLNTKYSNSIITYPSISSNELLNQDNIQKTVQYNKNNKNSKQSNNSNEIVETYFISPKKIKINKFQGDTNSLSDLDGEKRSFEKPTAQDQKELNESNPEMLKNFEDTYNIKESTFEFKMKYQNNNENFEKVDTNLQTQIRSLVDLSNSNEIALNLINNELNEKDLLNNTILGVTSDTESLKVLSNLVTISLTPPKKIYKINSDTSVLNTKTSVENKEDNKVATDKTFDSETCRHDPSFLKTILDNAIEMTCHEKEHNFGANTDVLEPLCLSKSEEIKLISEFVDNERHSNHSFKRQSENTKEIPNVDTGSIIPNTSIFFEENSNNISIVNNEVLPHNNNITTLNQDLQTLLIHKKQTSKSDFSNEEVDDSSFFNQKDNQPNLVHIREQRLLDSEINSNILSTNNINNSECNSKISNEFNEMTALSLNASNIDNDAFTNLTPLTSIKENKDQVLISIDNDLQIRAKIDSVNIISYDTKPNEIRSVKSYIEKSGLVIDSKETEILKKVQSSPLATLSMTSIEKNLHRLNNLEDIPSSESKDFDSTTNLGHGNSLITDIATNSKESEAGETFPVKNLEREDSLTKKNKSESNVSLSSNKHVKTPLLVELQPVSDKDGTHTDISMDNTKKLQENEIKINSNTMLSTNKENLQNSKETFKKFHDENLNNDIRRFAIVNSSTEIGMKNSRVLLNLENNVNNSKSDHLNGFQPSIISQNGTDKKDKHNFILPLSKTDLSRNNNLKETVYLNMAFQSFYTEKEGHVIRTVKTSNNDIKRYEDDNIVQFMNLARFDDIPITIPIDEDKNLLLKIMKTKEKENENQEIKKNESVSPKHDPKTHKLVVFDKDKDGLVANSNYDKNSLRTSIKKYITNNTKSEGSLQRTLDNVYNEKLLPLHNIIKDLKSDVDGLLEQRLLIKYKLDKEKGIQLHQISKNNKTCFCVEHFLMKH